VADKIFGDKMDPDLLKKIVYASLDGLGRRIGADFHLHLIQYM